MITSATTASGTVGTAFSYQITATNSPTSYSATGLPGGLSVNTWNGFDLRDTDRGGHLDGDVGSDQRWRNRQRHSDADRHCCGSGDHQRDFG